jgi:hypothetical protein
MEFKAEIEGIEEAKKLISARLMNEVLKYTNQDLVKVVRGVIKDKIMEGYNIKPGDLNTAMKIKQGADPLEQIIQINDADKRGIPIFKLAGRKAVQTREGVWAEIRRGRAKAFTQAFIQVMPSSGHRGVFVRFRGGSGKGGRMTRKDVGGKNPPIHEIYGPRITSLVKSPIMGEAIKKAINDNLTRIFKQKLAWKTGGLLGK